MGTLRRRRHSQQARVTAEAAQAFHNGDHKALHNLLRLPPWQASPIDATGDCPWPEGSAGAATWADAVALREELQAWAL